MRAQSFLLLFILLSGQTGCKFGSPGLSPLLTFWERTVIKCDRLRVHKTPVGGAFALAETRRGKAVTFLFPVMLPFVFTFHAAFHANSPPLILMPFYSEVAQAGIPLQSVSNDHYRYLNGLDDSHCHCSGWMRPRR